MSISFQGTLFDGETLAATPVTLALADGRISSPGETTVPAVPATAVDRPQVVSKNSGRNDTAASSDPNVQA